MDRPIIIQNYMDWVKALTGVVINATQHINNLKVLAQYIEELEAELRVAHALNHTLAIADDIIELTEEEKTELAKPTA